MASTTFSGPVTSTNGFVGDVTGAIKVPTYTVATAPSASTAGAGTVANGCTVLGVSVATNPSPAARSELTDEGNLLPGAATSSA